MATSKPRVQVTLDPSDHAILKRHCELTGRTMSSFFAETLSVSADGLSTVNKLMEIASDMDSEAKAMAEDVLDHGIHQLAKYPALFELITSSAGRNVSHARVAPAASVRDMRPAEENADSGQPAPFPLTRGSVKKKVSDNPPKPLTKKSLFLASSNNFGGK